MGQWVTTTDELSAGGRYASLLPKAQRTAAPSNHLPFQQSRTFLMRTYLGQQRISLVTERSILWMTYSLIGLHNAFPGIVRKRCRRVP